MNEAFLNATSLSPRRSMAYALAQRYVAFVVQFVTTIVLARLLTPAETGVFSLAAAAVAIGATLREFGTGDYLISQPNVDRGRQRAAYTVTIAIAWAVALTLLLVAHPLAVAYREPGVADVLYVLCLNFALVPLGSTAMALMVRDMRFDYLFFVQTAAVLVGSGVTIVCALNGLSYQSPAWGSVSSIAVTVLAFGVRQPSSVLMMPTIHGLRGVLRFGGTLTAARVVDGFAIRAPDFIVTGMLGFSAGGLLSKASSLNGAFYDFFGSAVLRVAMPLIARARQQGQDVREDFKRATVLMAAVQWLFFGLMVVAAPEIVLVLFGSRWVGAVPLLQILAIAGLFNAPFMLCQPLLTAYGDARSQLHATLGFGVILVISLIVGSVHSLEAAVAFSLLAHLARSALLYRASRRHSCVELAPLMAALRPTAILSIVSIAAAWTTAEIFRGLAMPDIIVLAATCISCALSQFGLIFATSHPMGMEIRRAIATLW